MTSFTVASKTRPTSFTSSSGSESDANRLPVGDGAVERGPRRGEEPGRRLLAPRRQLPVVHPEVGHRLHAGLQRAQGRTRLPRQRRGRVAQHLRVGRQRRRVPLRRQRHDARSRGEVEERRQHGSTAHPVEDGVMHLGDQRRAVTLEPLDHVHLPQRPVGVEWSAHDRRHECVQARPCRRATAGWPGVRWSSSSKSGSSTHTGWCRPNGTRTARCRNGGDQVQPLLDDPADLRIAGGGREEGARALGRVQHEHDAHVHGRRGRLEREKGGIHAHERAHHRHFLAAPGSAVMCRCARSRRCPAPTPPGRPRPPARRPPAPPGPAPAGRCGRPGRTV